MENMKIVFSHLTNRVSQTWEGAIETYESKPRAVQQEMFKKAMKDLYGDYVRIAKKVCSKKNLEETRFNLNEINFQEHKFVGNYYSETPNFAAVMVEAEKIGETVYEGYLPAIINIAAFEKEWKSFYDRVMKNFKDKPNGLAAFSNIEDYYKFIKSQFEVLLCDEPEKLQEAYDIMSGKRVYN